MEVRENELLPCGRRRKGRAEKV